LRPERQHQVVRTKIAVSRAQRGFPDAPEARSSGIWGGFPTISARSARDPMMSSTAGAVLGGARSNGGGERRATRTLLINASCHKPSG
jgi:hypothetical protein